MDRTGARLCENFEPKYGLYSNESIGQDQNQYAIENTAEEKMRENKSKKERKLSISEKICSFFKGRSNNGEISPNSFLRCFN